MKRELLAFALDLLRSTPFVEIPEELLLRRDEVYEIVSGERDLDEIPLLLEVTARLPRERGYVVGNGFSALLITGNVVGIDANELYSVYTTVRFGSGYLGTVHVHPVFLPIPSPGDALAAGRMGSRIEVVAAKARGHDENIRAVVTFYRPRPHVDWDEIAFALLDFTDDVWDIVARYLPVDEDGEAYFLPVPSFDEGIQLVRRFTSAFDEIVEASFVVVELEHSPRQQSLVQTSTSQVAPTVEAVAPGVVAQ